MPDLDDRRWNRGHSFLIGIDIGTSAVKGVLMSSEGAVVCREREGTHYEVAEGGRIQFDADRLYRITVDVVRRLAAAVPAGGRAAGLGMASASGNTVLVNGRGEPAYPAVSWMDTRDRGEMETVFGPLEDSEVHELTGWPLLPMFPLAHLSWLKCHNPELLEGAARICMSTDYILFKLTGSWGIDRSTATTFYLQDQKAAKWHRPYLEKLGIPAGKLPSIHPPGTVLGPITPNAAADTGLPAGTPVVLGAFDHPCAARGAGIFREEQLLLSCGTSWVGFFPLHDRRKAIGLKLLTDPFLQPAGPWGAMFSLPAVATAVDRRIVGHISDGPDRHREFDRLAGSSEPGAGGLLLNPMAEDDFDERNRVEKTHIARALMEGTAFLLKKEIGRMEAAGMRFSSVTMVGGPSESETWPQIVADVLGKEIRIVNGSCAGAVGSAILAGVGAGLYDDEKDAFGRMVFPEIVLPPDRASHERYGELYRRFRSKYVQHKG